MRSLLPFIAALVTASPAVAQEALRVAVVDTGVAATPRMAGMLAPPVDFSAFGRDRLESAHGTLVASIIAMRAKRPLAILPYRIDSKCYGTWCEMPSARIAAAVRNAVEQGADIIQISSYGNLTPAARDAILTAARAGVHVVLCAGNDGKLSPYEGIARHPNIHVVGALDLQGTRASYSSKGEGLVWRTGELVSENDRGRTQRVTGTSFAASVYTADLVNGWSQARRIPARSADAPAAVVAATATSMPGAKHALPAPIATDHSLETHVDAIAAPPSVAVERARSRAIAPPGWMGDANPTFGTIARLPGLEPAPRSRALPPSR